MFAGRRMLVALALISTFSHASFADSDKVLILIKGVKVDGGAMSGAGSTLTTIDGLTFENKYVEYAGWGLIVGGLLIGSGSTSSVEAKELAAKDVWNSVRSEARLVTINSKLIDDSSGIVAAANQAQISVHTLAILTQKVDAITGRARNIGRTLSVDEVVSAVSADIQYRSIVANMAQIALISQ